MGASADGSNGHVAHSRYSPNLAPPPHRVCTRVRHKPHSAFQLAHCPPTRLDPAPHRSTRPRLPCRTAKPRSTRRRKTTRPTAWPSSKRSQLGERSVPLATSLSPEPSTRPYRHGFNTQRSLNNPTQNTRRPHPLGGRSRHGRSYARSRGVGYGSRSDPPLLLLLTYTHPLSSLQRAAALLASASSGDEMGLKALLDEEGVRIEWKDPVGA